MLRVIDVTESDDSTFLVALHVVMWTTLTCGVIALMVVFLLTP